MYDWSLPAWGARRPGWTRLLLLAFSAFGLIACQGLRPEAPSSQAALEAPLALPLEPFSPMLLDGFGVSSRVQEPLWTNTDWIPPVRSFEPSEWADDVDLLASLAGRFSLPVVEQRAVEQEVSWYARHPEYLDRVFTRARTYLPYIVAELERRDMPLDLALLPVVESAFDPFAYSHGRAAGLWQIIPGTGRRFGLKQNWWYDGRRDVTESTRAALDYLELLADMFDGDWLRAIAAYNSGEGNVAKAVRRNSRQGKATDFWSISRRLPKETRAYVPRLLAIRDLVANPHRYGINLPEVSPKSPFEAVPTGGQLDMALAADLAEIDVDLLYALNPAVNRWATDPAGPHRLLIPTDAAPTFAARLAELGPRQRVKWSRHKVRSGQTIGGIAERYGTTARVLRQVNGLSGNTIRAGSHLMVPHAMKSFDAYTQTADARLARLQNKTRKGTRVAHRVRPGESFWTIARQYNVNHRSLAKWNGMAPRDTLSVGKELVVWTTGATPSAASTSNEKVRRVTYTVRRGDSLARIGSRFRVSVNQLLRWNKLSKDRYLQPGQRLVMYVDVTRQSS